jgi:hypothetical protein
MSDKQKMFISKIKTGNKNMLGKIHNEKTRKIMSEKRRAYKITELDRLHKREARLKKLKEMNAFISYNLNSIYYFDYINNKYDMKAYYGKNEYKIIGYSLDFYSPEYNLVIEWDEEAHYKNNILREKDIIRQKKIENELRCKFIRIREKEFLKEESKYYNLNFA